MASVSRAAATVLSGFVASVILTRFIASSFPSVLLSAVGGIWKISRIVLCFIRRNKLARTCVLIPKWFSHGGFCSTTSSC